MGWIQYKTSEDSEEEFGFMMIEFTNRGDLSIIIPNSDEVKFILPPSAAGIKEAEAIIEALECWVEKIKDK